MELAKFTIISRVEAALYVPVVSLTSYLIWKHGLRQGTGWIFLLAYALISGKLKDVQHWRHIAAVVNVMGRLGTNPLLWAARAFLLGSVSYACYQRRVPEMPILIYFSAGFLVLVFCLEVGGEWLLTSTVMDNIASWSWISPATIALTMFAYLCLLAVVTLLHMMRHRLSMLHRRVVFVLSLAFAPLFIRFAYNLAGLYAATMLPFSPWAQFVKDWRTYLFLGTFTEYLSVLIFLTLGFVIPPKSALLGPIQLELTPLLKPSTNISLPQ